MSKLAMATILFGLTAGPVLAAQAAEGVWMMDNDSARIRIAPCDNSAERLCGTIISIKPRPPGKAAPRTKDGKTAPSPRSFVGQTILVGMKPNGTNKWNGGKFVIPGMDREIKATMQLNKDGTLRVQGCVLVMCGGQNWKRAT